MAKKENDMKHVNLALPNEMHRLIKLTAVEKEMTMAMYIREAIGEKLRKDGKLI